MKLYYGARAVRCPTCRAAEGEACRDPRGRLVESHWRRVQIAKTGRDPWREHQANVVTR